MAATRHAGFTLIELVVVLAVGGILAAIALFSLANAVDKARQRDTLADMRELAQVIDRHMKAHQAPPSESDLAVLASEAGAPPQAIALKDRWSHAYRFTGGPRGYTIESFGKDGIDGPDITTASHFDFDLDIVLVNGVFVAAPE